MRILAFPGRLNTKAKAPVRDWSTQEIADFYRAHRLLADNGAGIGIDRGVSDEGEPWMVFFDIVSHDVFLHIARIDGACHLVCEPFNMRLGAADIPSLIAQFEHAVRDYLAIRSERAKNVVIHPAARIIMSISAVFLLFKLENGEAYAKGLEKSGAAAAEPRVSEKSAGAIARAQSAFQRAFDAAEAPMSAAVLAGIILASELALSPLRNTHSEAEVEKLVALALSEHEPVLVRADGAGIEVVVAEAMQHQPAPVAIERASVDVSIAVPQLADMPALVQFTPPDDVVQLAMLGAVADFRAAQFIPVAIEAPVKSESEGKLILAERTDAIKALEQFFIVAPAGTPIATSAVAEVAKPGKNVEISLDRLGEMNSDFGFSLELHLSDSQLFRLLQHYSAAMDGYEFQYKSGQVLIGQKGISALDEAELGLVTNVMTDGSTYTIVGKAELINDALWFFA